MHVSFGIIIMCIFLSFVGTNRNRWMIITPTEGEDTQGEGEGENDDYYHWACGWVF